MCAHFDLSDFNPIGKQRSWGPRKSRQRWATARWKFSINAERAYRAVGSNAVKPFPNTYTRWEGFKKTKNGFRIDSLKPTKISEWRLVCVCFSLLNKQKIFLVENRYGRWKMDILWQSETQKVWAILGKPSTSVAKPKRFGKVILLCVWWDIKGVIYYELLELSETVTALTCTNVN